jgi:predicted nucleic acid-binding Zn ribbon protein
MNIRRDPLFLRFINREMNATDLLNSFSKSFDPLTQEAVQAALQNPPDLESFRTELTDAVRDLITTGLGDEFKGFVNHYMRDSLEEDIQSQDSHYGESISRSARVKDLKAPWIQGFLCYNLCLYIKTFGLEELKICKVCGKFFDHKGKKAVYCSDNCKEKGREIRQRQRPTPPPLPHK